MASESSGNNSQFRSSTAHRQKIDWAIVRRTVGLAKPHLSSLSVFVAIVIVGASIDVSYAFVYRAIINDGILKQDSSVVVWLAVMTAGLGLCEAALGVFQTRLETHIASEIVVSLRIKLFDHIQRMPLAFFSMTQTGALVARLVTTVNDIRTAFTEFVAELAGTLVIVILIFGALFALSWQIALVVLILVPLFVLPTRYFVRRIRVVARQVFEGTAALAAIMFERFNVDGATLSKLFGRPADDVSAFETKARTLSLKAVKLGLYGRLNYTALSLAATIATALAYGWGGLLVINNRVDLGTLVAIVALLSRLYGPLRRLSNVHVNMMTALVSFERIFEILDLRPTIRDRADPLPIPPGPVRLSVDRVSFQYSPCAESLGTSLTEIAVPDAQMPSTVVSDISFNAEPGQLIALVGPSGAGKSTIARLIPRLYDVQTGSVRLNGVEIRDAKLEDVRARIGMVTQEVHLFHDTLRANLLYARPGASENEIRAALQHAQVLDVVDALPNGMDTIVGERGYRFSGGEKQRLAIARVLLKAPDLVILDEATAHLDSASEQLVTRALDEALRGRTSIVIAHRLTTIVRANRILVLQAGRIVEQGTHTELMAHQGVYAELFQQQFATQAVEAVVAANDDQV